METKKATERQVQIMQMVANNLKQAEIAVVLNISVRSLEGEVKKIRQIWGDMSLPALCVEFYRNGLIS